MRRTITISLPKDVKQDLDKATAEEGLSRSDLIRESLRDYLFMRRFRQLRARMMAKAQAQGIYTDEDVFKRLA
jgi:metal-responsive CopG/Arc/MetJ family transcriptional regulator